MKFNKDVMKKIVKYMLMVLVTCLAALSIPKNMPSKNEAMLIGLTASSVFVVLDSVKPSICLK